MNYPKGQAITLTAPDGTSITLTGTSGAVTLPKVYSVASGVPTPPPPPPPPPPTTPMLILQPDNGAPGTQVLIFGKNWGSAFVPVKLYFTLKSDPTGNMSLISGVMPLADGSFSCGYMTVIPNQTYIITGISNDHSKTASATFTVTGG